jgi:hypothetical protein
VRDVVPTSYSELVDHYWGYITQMLLRLGIPSEEVEDFGQEYLLRFFSKNRLEAYDPNYRGHPVMFSTFLGADVRLFALQQRRGLLRRQQQEPAPGPSPDFIVQLMSSREAEDMLEYRDTVQGIRQYLAGQGLAIKRRRGRRGRCTYVEVFDLCMATYEAQGRIDRKAVAKQLGVTDTVVGQVIRRIRTHVAEHRLDLALT